MLQAQLQLSVPPLPDTEVWFINAAAWTIYWQNIIMQATFNPAPVALYVPSPFDNTAPVQDLNIDGVDIFVPSLAQFNSLKAQVAALDAAFQDMRTQMKDAGYISNSQ